MSGGVGYECLYDGTVMKKNNNNKMLMCGRY